MWTKLSWRPGKLACNTALATSWQGLRLILQFFYLIIVARMLGAAGYGTFSGIVAIAVTLSPLAGFGYGLILVKQASQNPILFPVYWGKLLSVTLISAPLLLLSLNAIGILILPKLDDLTPLIVVGLSELLLVPLVSACANAYQAHERLGAAIFNYVLLNGGRLLSIGILSQYNHRPNLAVFSIAHFAGTALAAVTCLTIAVQTFGRPRTKLPGLFTELGEGLGFTLSNITNAAQSEIDKSLLLSLDGATSAGTYSAATRIAHAATIPLISFVLAAVPRLFRDNNSCSLRILILPVVIYGLLAASLIYFIAPLLPGVLGNEFADSALVLRMLAPLPFLYGISNLLLGVLSCSGSQRKRVILELLALSLGICLNIILIPQLGIYGTVYAALASQGILAGMSMTIIFTLYKNPTKNNPNESVRT